MLSEGGDDVIVAPIQLDLQSAVDDSPRFRASVYRNEEELDALARILDNLIKALRNCLELGARNLARWSLIPDWLQDLQKQWESCHPLSAAFSNRPCLVGRRLCCRCNVADFTIL